MSDKAQLVEAWELSWYEKPAATEENQNPGPRRKSVLILARTRTAAVGIWESMNTPQVSETEGGLTVARFDRDVYQGPPG